MSSVAACGGPTEPGAEVFRFSTQAVFGFPRLDPSISVVDGKVQVTGLMITPTTGYSVLGELTRPQPRQLVVTVTGTNTSQGLNFPGQTYYSGTVSNLAAGDYDVVLIHILSREARDSSLQLRRTVSVP